MAYMSFFPFLNYFNTFSPEYTSKFNETSA